MTRRLARLGAALALPLVLTALPTRAFAACDDLGDLLSRVYPKADRSDDGFDLKGAYAQHVTTRSVACKVWPADPGLTLMAVPRIEADPASPDETRGDVEILVLDSATGRPLARRVETAMAFADAIRFEGVTLDTARYDLRPGLRAFGLRTEQSGSSRVNPYGERALWLYTFEGGRIARVLDGLIVQRIQGENDGNCAGTSQTVRRAVSLGAEGPEGYRDLMVDQTATDETSRKVGRDCRSTETPGARARHVLRFGGRRYEPSAELRPIVDRSEDRWFSLIMSPPFVAASSKAAAAPRPSFECAKATTKVERAICADAPLAKADAEVATLYRERRAALLPAAAALLTQDETYFLGSRERVYGYGETNPNELLLAVIRGRADFLRSLRPPSGDGPEGSWGNLIAKLTVARGADGLFQVDINGNEPVTARWVCDVEGTGRLADGVLEVKVETDGSTLRLRRDGQTLKVEAVPPSGKRAWTPGYCGLNGSIAGDYFATQASSQ